MGLLFKKESLKVSVRGVLYDVNRKQYKRGITEAVIYKDADGFILWSTVHGSGKVYCEANISNNTYLERGSELPDLEYTKNPRYKGYYIAGSALSESEAFELIDGC